MDAQQKADAVSCLLKDQCGSVFDKPDLEATLQDLRAACAPPRLCSADAQKSIAELKDFYVQRESIKPDTTIEEFLLTNKTVVSAFGVAKDIIAPVFENEVKAGVAVGVVEGVKGAGKIAGTNAGFDTANLQSKLEGYLLDPAHPQNQTKAIWFQQALGFDKSNWQQLGSQITFNESTAIATKTTRYGQTFEQVIRITGVNGKTIDVPFVFMKDNTGTMRLVTGIPAKK